MMKLLLFMLNGLLIFSQLAAQDVTVHGSVQSQEMSPLVGVTVMEAGTSNGTVTDEKGAYHLRLNQPEGAVLVFTYTGYKRHRIPVEGRTRVDAVLSFDVKELDKLVVVGYGSVRKGDLTGAVSSVDVAEMEKSPISDLSQALTGRAAGVQVTTSEGAPGAGVSIKIRGGGSITQSNEPLYIVDGIATDDISTLDPTDIASISILKDASATAIYGARGANGVVVVTTKSGKPGRTHVTYHGYVAFKWLANRYDVLDPLEFVRLEYERTRNDEELQEDFTKRYGEWSELEGLYGNRPGIDWQDEVFDEPALHQYHKIGIDGGSEQTTYYLTVSHDDNQGQMIESGFRRNQATLKLKHEVSRRLTARVNVRYTDQKIYGMSTSEETADFNKLRQILQYRPTIGKDGKDEDLLNFYIDPALEMLSGRVSVNPLTSAQAEQRDRLTKVLALNGRLDFKVTKGLRYSFTYGYSFNDQMRKYFDGEHSVKANRSGGPSGYLQNSKYFRWTYTNLLEYKTDIHKDHHLNLLLGQEEHYSGMEWFRASSAQFPNGDIGLNNLALGALPDIPQSHAEDSRLLSFFGRANYNFKDRWLVTATLRADGSSKFGSGNKYGVFPSAAVAWRLNKETFIKNLHLFDDLKLRVSYGEAGNNRIPNYSALAMLGSGYYPLNDVPKISAWPEVLPDPNLRWETTISRNIGLDAAFLKGRLQLQAEIYKNTTKDLLLAAQVPFSTGYATVIKNVGKTENKGVEISIHSVNIDQGNFRWSTGFNLSFNRNQVLALADQEFFLRTSGWSRNKENDFLIAVGRPLGLMYGYVTDGLYQVNDFDYDPAAQQYTLKQGGAYDPNWIPKPGYWKFKDLSGPDGKPDGKITPEDKTVIGNANPKFYGGITNTFAYKHFDLSLFFNWSYGADVYNANKLYYSLTSSPFKNQLGLVRNRWTTVDAKGQVITDPEQLAAANKNKKIPSWDGAGSVYPTLHSWAIEDGSFLRLNTISLGYTLQGTWLDRLHISRLRLYATAYNVAVITGYSGYDPEVGTRGNALTPNVDWGAYPRSKSFVFGVNLSF